MPRDARLGFVLGVALVILIAVIFYHGDGKAGPPGNVGPAGAKSEDASKPAPSPKVRTHVVKEGETLVSLALKYYQDADRRDVLLRANQSQFQSAKDVRAGLVLVVPDLPADATRGAK